MHPISRIILFILSGWIALSCSDAKNKTVSLEAEFPPVIDSILQFKTKNTNSDSLFRLYRSCTTDTGKISVLLRSSKFLPVKYAIDLNHLIISIAKKNKLEPVLTKAYLYFLYLYANQENKDSTEYYHHLLQKRLTSAPDTSANFLLQIYYALYFQRKRDFSISDSILLKVSKDFKNINYNGSYEKALDYYYLGKNKSIQFKNNEALALLRLASFYSEKSKADELTGDIYFRIGECYLMESDYNNALAAYGKALEIAARINDVQTSSSCESAIGEIYMYKEDFSKAYEHLFKSLTSAKKINYIYQQGYTLASLGCVFLADSNYKEALNYFDESNKVYTSYYKGSLFSEITMNNLNIASAYTSLGDYNKALKFLQLVMDNLDVTNDPGIAAETFNCYGEIFLQTNKLKDAETYCQKALLISKQNDFVASTQHSYELLYKIYESMKKFETALVYHKAFTHLADSLTNKTQIKKFAEMENEVVQNKLIIEHERKETELRKEKTKKEEELSRQRITSIIVTVGFIVLLIFAVIIYKSLQENKKKTVIISEQKKQAEQQKEIIEEKKKEVMDSIAYAKKIQEAILPSNLLITSSFKDSFVIYKPKDIVAGDFYWLEKINGKLLIAVADCTGHGVPGAMVSVVCSNALNRAVKEFGLEDPGLILDKVREMVIDTFEKSGSDVKDGMDISLAAIPEQNGELITIQWAGANNPLWYISDGQLIEIKANKQPVGKYIQHQAFQTNTISLKSNSLIYLITDGFADQFGGPKGKKFKYRNLKELLTEIALLPMSTQKEILLKEFDSWKHHQEQVDDVTILGIKV